MPKHRYLRLVDKSRFACIAAIEVFNGVLTPYREENFVILIVNAWELLLKAKIIADSKGKIESIYVKKEVDNKSDRRKRNWKYKLNRTNTPHTIGLLECLGEVKDEGRSLDKACYQNILSLMEYRDQATHFISDDVALRKTITELSIASVRNYVMYAQKWFGVSFIDINTSTLPLSFDLDHRVVDAAAIRSSEQAIRFLEFVSKLQDEARELSSDFSYTISVNYELLKNGGEDSVTSTTVRENEDYRVKIEPNTLPNGFDWDYQQLLERLKKSCPNFKQSKKFYDTLAQLKKDKGLAFENFSDPKNRKGSKWYYNPNIVRRFVDIFAA